MPTVSWHEGPRDDLRPLFEEADDSPVQLAAYAHLGRVLVVREDDEVLGHLQLITTGDEAELKSMAVVEEQRGAGLGRRLVEAAVVRCREEGIRRLLVSTAAAGVGELRFYQRMGFRVLSVERDAFTPETGYPEGIEINGIPLRDRVWLDLVL